MITKKVTVRLIGGDQHAICHEAFDFGTESLTSVQVEAYYENHDQLRAMAKELMKVADECEFDPRSPPPQTSNQILAELGPKNRQLEILQEQLETLTTETNELRDKYMQAITKESIAGEKS